MSGMRPFETITRKENNKLRRTYARIEQIISEYDVTEIVVGYPKNMDCLLYTSLTYECRMKYESEQKQFIDELRVRNGNLNITMGMMPRCV